MLLVSAERHKQLLSTELRQWDGQSLCSRVELNVIVGSAVSVGLHVKDAECFVKGRMKCQKWLEGDFFGSY